MVVVQKSKEHTDVALAESNNPSSSKRPLDSPSTSAAKAISGPTCSPPKSAKKEVKSSTQNGSHLKNVFPGFKLHITDSQADKEKVCRYFVAYDGEVVDNFQVDSDTLLVCTDDEASSFQLGKRIQSRWIFDSAKAGEAIDCKSYTI